MNFLSKNPSLRCQECYLPKTLCLCSLLPTVKTKTEILLLRHRGEIHSISNTGRLAGLILTNSKIIDYGTGEPFDPSSIRMGEAWVLYPGNRELPSTPLPSQLIVLDATFPQARRMYQRISAFREIPVFSLQGETAPRNRLRDLPEQNSRSTLEAIAEALKILEDDFRKELLFDIFDEYVRRVDLYYGKKR